MAARIRVMTCGEVVRRANRMIVAMRGDAGVLTVHCLAESGIHRSDTLQRHGDDQDDGQQKAPADRHLEIVQMYRHSGNGGGPVGNFDGLQERRIRRESASRTLSGQPRGRTG